MASSEAGSSSSSDAVPDWFLGGRRRRLLLEVLAGDPSRGWTVTELTARTGCAQATAYEALRVLSDIGLLRPPDRERRYRLAEEHGLAEPLRSLLRALEPYSSRPVDRPARGARRT